MSYIERALERSDELWRAQEDELSKKIDSVPLPSAAAEEKTTEDTAEDTARSAVQDNAAGQKQSTAPETGLLHNEVPESGSSAEGKTFQTRKVMAARTTHPDRTVTVETEVYRRRLAEKLLGADAVEFPRQTEERALQLRREETARAWSASEVQTENFAPKEEKSGVSYLVQALQGISISGLAGARQTGSAAVSEIVRDGLNAQTLSRGLERDARRYDGGFLLY